MLLVLLCLVLAGVIFLRWFVRSDGLLPVQETPQPILTEESTQPITASPVPTLTQVDSDASSPAETKQPFVPPQGYTEESYRLVSDMVYAYAYQQDAGAEIIQSDLEKLNALDPALGALWQKLMDCWRSVNTDLTVENGVLPDGLPEDDSLCIVVLGFQLHPDGSMSQELEGRCEVALASAEKYPNAIIAVTGGGTAWQNPAATEAGVMASWLVDHGVAPERILIEDASLTTSDNAVFTCGLLKERFPQVRTLAIVSSDYHLPLGVLLFQEQALIDEYETGSLPFSVAACAGFDTEGRVAPDSPAAQKSYLWEIADPDYS